MVQLVSRRRVPGERVRVNIMIDKGLLRLTEEAAEAGGLRRSAFVEAADRFVALRDGDRSRQGAA